MTPTIYSARRPDVTAVPRRDTLARWLQYDPVLRQDELAYETDTDRFRVGDGRTRYSELPVYAREQE